MAYFPDGTTRVQTIEIIGEEIALSSNYLTLLPLGSNMLENDEPVPVAGLNAYIFMEVWLGPHFDRYDGPDFYNWKFSELFDYQFSQTFGTITPTQEPEIFPGNMGYDDGGYRVFHYNVEININKNTRPIDQYIALTVYRKGLTPQGGNKSIFLTSVRFTQEHE